MDFGSQLANVQARMPSATIALYTNSTSYRNITYKRSDPCIVNTAGQLTQKANNSVQGAVKEFKQPIRKNLKLKELKIVMNEINKIVMKIYIDGNEGKSIKLD